MRQIVLDTETTGFDPHEGHRLVEIGAVELINHALTGSVYHVYINPERDMPEEAFKVHGLSEEFLSTKPVFADVCDDFLAFISDSQLVIHNAKFDMKFLNAELGLLGRTPLPMAQSLDTLEFARDKYPGQSATLDALCKRLGVDNSGRTKHGALLDAELLAEVYVRMVYGREPSLDLSFGKKAAQEGRGNSKRDRVFVPPRSHSPSSAEYEAHKVFVARLKNPLWLQEKQE